MKVELLSPQYEALYEDYVNSQENAMIYYSLKFRDFLTKLTGCQPLYYIALKDGEIAGVLPLMQKDGSLGKVINSLPYYGSNGGIFSEDQEAKKLLRDHYVALTKQPEIAAATLIENPLTDNHIVKDLPCDESDYRIGQFTKLEKNYQDLENLMTLFHYKTRNMIRKALKADVEISVENDQFHFLEATHQENMQAIGGMAKSPQFFQAIQNTLTPDKHFKLYIAKHQGKPIAALLNLYYNNVVEYYTPVIVKDFRSSQPLSLIIAQAMLDASQQGFVWWNWGGTWVSQEGVYKFKSRWGTQDINYHYYITINNKDIYKTSREKLLSEYANFYVIPFNKLEK